MTWEKMMVGRTLSKALVDGVDLDQPSPREEVVYTGGGAGARDEKRMADKDCWHERPESDVSMRKRSTFIGM